MCNMTVTAQAERERLLGRQQTDYGYGGRYARANYPLLVNNTYLPYEAHPAPGNIGYKLVNPMPAPMPIDYERGYSGILPLSQQPRLDVAQPYSYRYVAGL